MERKKNNALEKAENIANPRRRRTSEQVMAKKRADEARKKQIALEEKQKQKEQDKREKAIRKAEEKENKKLKKQERQEEKRLERERNKKERKGYGGWLAAVISLAIATLVLSSVLTFTFLMPSESDSSLESAYRKSFYDTVDQVNNIDLNLSKVLATKDKGTIQTYLLDLAVNSELCENDLHELPLEDESKHYTTKLVNQIGDYAKYLNKKLANGENLTNEDRDVLISLYKANMTFKETLNSTMDEMGNDFSFSKIGAGDSGNALLSNFNDLQNLSVEYPELIYDGPFSDGKDRKQVKGLTGEIIDEERAKEIFLSIFAEYGIENVMLEGMTESNIKCFNLTADVNGDKLYAQISSDGGKLIMFSYAGSCNDVKIQSADAEKTATDFLQSLGIENMKPVWINLSSNLYTINFASLLGDTIVYSDLIKVRVCAETNTVIGIEATSYYTNHCEREEMKPSLSISTAYGKVSDDIEVESERLAVIPVGESSEKLCYEFMGRYDGATYYVYIDAETGRQVEMFKVVESTEGTLLM